MKNTLTSTFRLLASAAGICLAASSCTPYQQQGAGIGALGGAALGAVVGNDSGDILRGAAVGAAAGTGVAAYRENQSQRNNVYDNNNAYTNTQQSTYQAPDPYQAPAPDYNVRTQNSQFPKAMKGVQPNTVISPYAPHNVLDVTGLRSGQKICDPSTIPIDPKTGRRYVDPRTGEYDWTKGKYCIVP